MKLIHTLSICMLLATGAAFADWSDNFDSYAAGGGIIGQGGWEGWDGNPGADGLVTTAQAQSAPNSFSAIQTTDIVQQFTGVNAGMWSMSASCYIPSGSTGIQYFILLSIYIPSGTNEWCTDIKFNNGTGLVGTEEGTGTTSIISTSGFRLKLFSTSTPTTSGSTTTMSCSTRSSGAKPRHSTLPLSTSSATTPPPSSGTTSFSSPPSRSARQPGARSRPPGNLVRPIGGAGP